MNVTFNGFVVAAAGGLSPAGGAGLLGADGGWVTGQVLSPNGGVVLGR